MPLGHRAAPRRHRRRGPSRRRLLVAGLGAAVVLLGVVAVLAVGGAAPAWVAEWPRPARPAETARPAVWPGHAGQRGVEVLRGWDEARAAAYASGSVGALRELYAGAAGADDVRLLRSYLRRGYRVEGLRMQLLAVTVRAHRPGVWLLRVTDRLAGGVAVGHGERVALPRDRASARTVRFARGHDGRWRVVSVRA